MRVNSVDSVTNPKIRSSQNNNRVDKTTSNLITFKSGISKTSLAYSELISRGITYNYEGRSLPSREFMSDCIRKSVEAMGDLFGNSSLPKIITLGPLDDGVYGGYINTNKEIVYNSELDCFNSMKNLKALGLSKYNLFGPSDASTYHPAHVFIHELGHSAHWEHLERRHGTEDANKIWLGLVGTTVPNSIGRLITRYALGRYAVDSMDLAEFVAERITQDVCNAMPLKTELSLSDDDVYSWKGAKGKVDVDYETIYNRKHNYRYSGPQSYLDYFMQQLWNGDLEGADKVARDTEEYLASLETNKVPDVVVGAVETVKKGAEKIAAEIDKIAPQIFEDGANAISEGVNAVAKGVEAASEKVRGFFGKITDSLDKKNKIKINRW